MIPVPAEVAKSIKSAAAESKLKIKGVFRRFAESPFFVLSGAVYFYIQERKGYI